MEENQDRNQRYGFYTTKSTRRARIYQVSKATERQKGRIEGHK
jgi:hypothetical protein